MLSGRDSFVCPLLLGRENAVPDVFRKGCRCLFRYCSEAAGIRIKDGNRRLQSIPGPSAELFLYGRNVRVELTDSFAGIRCCRCSTAVKYAIQGLSARTEPFPAGMKMPPERAAQLIGCFRCVRIS